MGFTRRVFTDRYKAAAVSFAIEGGRLVCSLGQPERARAARLSPMG